MSPRLLGCKAVTVRSFGRIHKTNLKKWLIPLAFSDPDGYAKVLEADTISVTGLANLRPVQPVKAIVHRFKGSDKEIELRHTMSEEQLEWVRAGRR